MTRAGAPVPNLPLPATRRRRPRQGWLITAILPLVAGCTPSHVGGVRGQTAFAATARIEIHNSRHAAADMAACFRKSAKFLPKSRFTAEPDGSARYRLAGHGLWFEEIDFMATPTGSRIEVRSSAAYDARWIARLARDRLEPLGACLANPWKA